MKTSYARLMDEHLAGLLREVPAVAVDGLKGVGKTVSSKRAAKSVFELDRDADADIVANDVARLAKAPPPVLIDEWQKVPKVWDFVRRAVDDGAEPGRYLLTGSIANTNTDIHSGAGRILRVRMFPLALGERGVASPSVSLRALFQSAAPFTAAISGDTAFAFENYVREITASGLPGLRRYTGETLADMLESYLQNLLSHEFIQQGVRIRQPHTLLRWLKAYAAATATDAAYSEILDASTAGESDKPASKTVIAYREALGNLWLLDELPAWTDGAAYVSKLKLTPKHYLADPALAAHLLGIDADTLLNPPGAETRFDARHGNILGRFFESLAHLSLRVCCSVNRASLSFLRTRDGAHEIDFIAQRGRKTVAFEVKLAPTVGDADVRHLLWLRGVLKDRLQDAVILTTGRLAYRREDGIAVVPLALLGA